MAELAVWNGAEGFKGEHKEDEVLASSRREIHMNIKDRNNSTLQQVYNFEYLGVTLDSRGGPETAVKARVTAAWAKWRELSGVKHDKKMPRKLKVKLYNTIIRPVLLYGVEVWTM